MKLAVLFVYLIFLIRISKGQYELNPIEETVESVNDDNINESSQNKSVIKIGFKLNHLDSALVDIIWCGNENDDNTVLVLSEKGSVYRSGDKGMTWEKKTEYFQRQAYIELEENEQVGVVQKIMLSPVDKNLVLFVGSHGINWKSGDCGQQVTAMNQGRVVTEFQFHPTQRNSLLAVAWSRCDDYDDEPCRLTKELYVSTDLGESWKLIEDYVVQFQWAYLDHSLKGIVNENRIILAHEPKGDGHQNLTKWSKRVHISYSDNFFKTRNTIVNYGNKFLLTKKFLYAVQVKKENKQEVNLLVANPRTVSNYNFIETQFPFGNLKERSYTILDSESNSVFLNINHQGDNAKYGHLYISDEKGVKFSLAIENNARDGDGTCDFEKVLSLDGIYLVNFYEQSIIQKYRKQQQDIQKSSTIKQIDLESYKKTKISFNNGGSWQYIQAPSKDSRGKNIDCLLSKGCSLHFHTVTSSDMYGSFYSTEKAVGVIIGTGNTGFHLSRQKGDVNTYLSRDGGRQWIELMKGSYIYEIGDHGGILLMASDEVASNTLFYSWNEGQTLHSFTFSQQKIKVQNIITEPSNSALSFILYGKDDQDQGVLISLDFGQYHNKQCKGLEIPDHENSDYELWNIMGIDKNQCVLGRKDTIVRKKLNSMCYNGAQFDKKIYRETCKCTEQDYECDTGYSREQNGPCRLTNSTKMGMDLIVNFWDQQENQKVLQNCTDYYYIPSGYRKIPGDICKNGITYEPVKIPCPKAIKEIDSLKEQLKHRRLVIGSVIMAIIFLIIYLKAGMLVQNFKTIVQNIQFLINRKNFNYAEFINDEEDIDFSKMVFDDQDQQEENPQILEENKLI